jgi:HAD superfamily hydrolase (TIGR01509 family)
MNKSDTLQQPPRIELIIFDCDGVLVDSEILSKRELLSMLKELGADVSDDYFYTHFLGFNFEHVAAKVWADFSIELTDEFRQRYREKLIEAFEAELTTTHDLTWLLTQLNVKSCVATSGSPEKVSHSLRYTNLDKFFKERVFTSSEVKRGKPAPDLFLHVAQKMGVSPENCLVIEDSQTGIKAALAAKMPVIRYAGASHMQNRNTAIQFGDDVSTIDHWNQLFDKFPSLNSPIKN